MSTTTALRVGQKVVVKPEVAPSGIAGRVFTVKKINPKNLRCSADDGGRGLNYPAEYLQPYDPASAPQAPSVDPYGPWFSGGEIVTFKVPPLKANATPETLFVVLVDKGDKVNVVRLGGDGGRYWRATRANLVLREVEAITLASQ